MCMCTLRRRLMSRAHRLRGDDAGVVEIRTDLSDVARGKAVGALTDAVKQESALRERMETARDRSAAAIVNAREVGVAWDEISGVFGGVTRQSLTERVMRFEARSESRRSASWEGTRIETPPGAGHTGAWRLDSVRQAAANGADLAAAAARRAHLVDETDPRQIQTRVRAVGHAALAAAKEAVVAAETGAGPEGVRDEAAAGIAFTAAAGYLPGDA